MERILNAIENELRAKECEIAYLKGKIDGLEKAKAELEAENAALKDELAFYKPQPKTQTAEGGVF